MAKLFDFWRIRKSIRRGGCLALGLLSLIVWAYIIWPMDLLPMNPIDDIAVFAFWVFVIVPDDWLRDPKKIHSGAQRSEEESEDDSYDPAEDDS
jgi:hypothetical protein